MSVLSANLAEAIESAVSGDDPRRAGDVQVRPHRRRVTEEHLRYLIKNVLRDLPEEASVAELLEAIEEAST